MNYKFLYLLICILGLHSLTAQQHQVIDRKGTLITVTSSQVSTTSIAPANPNEGDVWIDTASNTLKIWEEGTVPAWKEIASIRNWIPSSQNGSYLVNHLVSYEGALYKNMTGTNSVTTPDLDTTNWEALKGEGNAVPLWESLTNGGSYTTNDIINHNGILYKNLTGTNSVTTPDLDTTNWAALEGEGNAVPLWESLTNGGSYVNNDVINYNGMLYKNLTGTNSVTTPDLDTTNWEALKGEGNAVPLWESLTNGGSYVNNDVINYNGMLYKNLTGTNSVTTPDLDTTNWEKIIDDLYSYEYVENTSSGSTLLELAGTTWVTAASLTIPSDGTWDITGEALFGTNDNGRAEMRLTINGSNIAGASDYSQYSEFNHTAMGHRVENNLTLTAGDVINFQVRRFAGTVYLTENFKPAKIWAKKVAGFLPVVKGTSDADGDTKIDVEQAVDEDIIRFTTAGTERLRLNGSRIEPLNNSFSVFIGNNAGTDVVTSSSNNVFIGRNAGNGITTGSGNVALGSNAMRNNDAGINNTAIGINSLQSNQNATGIVAVGARALLSNTSGIQNVALGLDALKSNTTGAYNIGIGPNAGRYIADGSTPRETGGNNIYIGKDTKASVDGTLNEIVIGTNVFGKGSNTITLGSGASTELYTAADIISKRFHTIWKSSVNIYNTNDIVIYNGALYKNLLGSNTAVAPDSDTTNWENLAPQSTYEYMIARPNVSQISLSIGNLFPYNTVVESDGSSITSHNNGKFTLATNGTYRLTATTGTISNNGFSAWRFYNNSTSSEIETSSVGLNWGRDFTAEYSDDPTTTAIIKTGASPITLYLRKVSGRDDVNHQVDLGYTRARIFIEKLK